MRYFLFSYHYKNGIVGNMWFEADGFPSNDQLKNIAAGKIKPATGHEPENNSIVISSVFEFQNEKDFLSFCGGE